MRGGNTRRRIDCKVARPRPTRPWPIRSRTSPSSRRRGPPAPRGEGQINRANTHVNRLIYRKDTERGESRGKSLALFVPHPLAPGRWGRGRGRAGGTGGREGATWHSSCSAQLVPKRACTSSGTATAAPLIRRGAPPPAASMSAPSDCPARRPRRPPLGRGATPPAASIFFHTPALVLPGAGAENDTATCAVPWGRWRGEIRNFLNPSIYRLTS
jgi:hypothetical protein